MEKSKILWIIYSTYPDRTGGRETWIQEISKRLHHYRPIIVSLRKCNQKRVSQVYESKVYQAISIPPPHIPLGLPLEMLWNVISLTITSIVVFIQNRNDIKIIHAHLGLLEALPGILLKKMFKTKLVIQIHGFPVDELSTTIPLKFIWKFILSLSLKAADLTVFVSRQVEDFHRKYFPVNNAIVIYPGVDSELYTSSGDRFNKLDLLRQANIGCNAPSVILGLNVASLRPWIKGQDLLLKATSKVLRKFKNFYLLFVGGGDPTYLKTLAKSLDIDTHVGFLGERKDIPKILRSVDIVIHASRLEGLPIALLEAMGAGNAIVATKVGGVSEIIEDGVNGYLVEPNNSDALASAIISILCDEKKRKAICKNNCLKAFNFFNWDIATDTISQAYNDLLTFCSKEKTYVQL